MSAPPNKDWSWYISLIGQFDECQRLVKQIRQLLMTLPHLRPPLQLQKTSPIILLPPHRIVVVFYFWRVNTPIWIEHLLCPWNVNHGRHWQVHSNLKRFIHYDTPARTPPPLARRLCYMGKKLTSQYRLMNEEHLAFMVRMARHTYGTRFEWKHWGANVIQNI